MYGTYLEVTAENILSLVTPYDIYSHYIPWFKVGKSILSPFVTETRPSFWTKVVDNNQIIFIDFARGYRGDCFKFVMCLRNCTYWEALEYINTDLRLKLGRPLEDENDIRWHLDVMRSEKHVLPKSDRKNITVLERPFELHDLAYWYAYGANLHYLNLYDVNAISDFWIDDWWQGVHKWAYSWNTIPTEIKIYQPFANKSKKWRSNTSNDWLQGEKQLPKTGKHLLIQSSMKDIVCVANRYRLPSIAPNGEHGIIPKQKLDDFERRFDRISILYDNDLEGIKAAKNMIDSGRQYTHLILPSVDGKPKDPSDFIFMGHHRTLDEYFKTYVLWD
jgi:hypothetical protein